MSRLCRECLDCIFRVYGLSVDSVQTVWREYPDCVVRVFRLYVESFRLMDRQYGESPQFLERATRF